MAEQTINPLPTAGSDFLEVLVAFLQNEDAQRLFSMMPLSSVVVGGLHGTVAGLTATPTALVAFPGGFYITETGSITYSNAVTTWVIAHKDTIGNQGSYIRVPGTHYLTFIGVSPPLLPPDCVELMQVTTSGGAITAVVDFRQHTWLVNYSIDTLSGGSARLSGINHDLRLIEGLEGLYLEVNTAGRTYFPTWESRIIWRISDFLARFIMGNTAERSYTFPDKNGTVAMLSDISGSAFAPGTRMLFDNDAAPAGWVRDVSLNDRMVRIVSGARADGGSWTVGGLTASGHAITIAEMPAHTHGAPNASAFSTTEPLAVQVSGAGPGGVAAATASEGGGNQHTHNIASDANWRPLHRDVIVCVKS